MNREPFNTKGCVVLILLAASLVVPSLAFGLGYLFVWFMVLPPLFLVYITPPYSRGSARKGPTRRGRVSVILQCYLSMASFGGGFWIGLSVLNLYLTLSGLLGVALMYGTFCLVLELSYMIGIKDHEMKLSL
jgi:hypothetical protein